MLQQVRMPYVKFFTEVRETVDENGHILRVPEYRAEVTPAGGKDTQIKVMSDWLPQLRNMSVSRGPVDTNAAEYEIWYEKISQAFEKYKKGEEVDYDGTPLRGSLAFTKVEIANCEAANVFTIEDLALASEESIQRIGMGGRNLKDRANKIVASQSSNDLAAENAALKLKVNEMDERIKELVELVGQDRKTLTVKKAA